MSTVGSVRMGVGFGVGDPVGERRDIVESVIAVERAGFDSLWLSEVATSPAPDPIAVLAFAAALTERIKLGTSVLVLPGRPPALIAQALATIDVLSSGRTLPIFGLGTIDPAEQQAFGVSREDRGPWVEEALPLLRRFWTGKPVTHAGDRFTYEGVHVAPQPVRGSLPIWLGGRSPGELRRAGRLGDGWLASFATPAEVGRGRAAVAAAAAECGRSIEPDHYGVLMLYELNSRSTATLDFLSWRRPDVSPEEVLPAGPRELTTMIEAFIAHGCTKFVLVPAVRCSSWQRELEQLAEIVLPLERDDAPVGNCDVP